MQALAPSCHFRALTRPKPHSMPKCLMTLLASSNVEEFRLSNIWAELAAGARLIERRGSGDPLERKAIIASLVGSHEEAEHYIKLLMHRNRTGIRVVDTDPSARILTRSVS